MFEGFEERRVAVGEAELYLRLGGDGPPLLLLHGYPQTHVIWRRVAPLLARDFTLVIPDLRGYGASTGPAPDPKHRNYSKRAMAADMVALMAKLGHERFALAGHDRGGRVAYRLCLDHPKRVTRFAALDIVPTLKPPNYLCEAGSLAMAITRATMSADHGESSRISFTHCGMMRSRPNSATRFPAARA